MIDSTLLSIDKRARLIISVLYRVLILSYGSFVALHQKRDVQVPELIFICILYLICFKLTFGKDGVRSWIRLICDYSFIFYIIWKLPVDNFFVSALLFLPILNSSNHSSSRGSWLLYIIPASFLIYYYNFSLYIIFPFFVFSIVNAFGLLRHKYISLNDHLNTLVDKFLISPESIEKPYKIYERVIEVFNKSSLVLFDVGEIMCFKIKNENITLVNASFFIWTFTVEDELIEKIKSSRKGSDSKFHSDVIINSKQYEKNFFLSVKVGDSIYCYVILPKKDNFVFSNQLVPFFEELVSPFFFRISKIFEAYSERKRLEIEAIVQMERKVSYVQNAKSAMHFIRNKLGPLSNYLAMVADYESETDTTDKKSLKAIIINERNKLSSSVDEILKRAHYVLDRSNNPFLVNELAEYNIKKLYSETKRVWETYFPVFLPRLNWDVFADNYVVKFNAIGLDFVLVNWINNMKKYGGEKQTISLDEDQQYIKLNFANSITDLLGAQDVVYVFNADDRIEILQRKTHGIVEIIDFLNQMNIEYSSHIDDDGLHLILKFKKHTKK